MTYATVLVGTDGSESSLKAVDRAAEIAAAMEALLIVVCAYHPMSAREQAIVTPSLGDTRFYQVAGVEAAEEALAVATKRAADAGASGTQGRLVKGDAGQALLSMARENSADLIVVGNRGINTLSGRLLGSVPSDVSQRSQCDVLIVHTTEAGRG
ncbi:MAG TPA: universal stress protein [Catenuloplanes sp.]|jgi:nucleotide-binding universal stress UspA family protein